MLLVCGNMNEIAPAKYMRPKPFAVRTGVSGRTVYRWIDLKIIPSYKFQGVLLIDIEEADLIIKGVRRHEIKAFPKSKSQQKTESATVAE
jgi:hypothetical protein